MDITTLVRLRRRCVFGALVGYLVAGLLVLFVFAHPAFLLAALALTVSSAYAERGSRSGAIVQTALTSAAIGFMLWEWFDFSNHVAALLDQGPLRSIRPGTHWRLTLLALMGAGAIGVVVWSLVAALTYNRELTTGRAPEPRVPFRCGLARKLEFLRSRRFFPMVLYFALSVAVIAGPLAVAAHWWRVIQSDWSRVPSGWWLLPGIMGFLSLLAMSRWAFARARRLAALGVAQARQRDSRAPVLLLRSFRDDLVPVEPKFSVRTWRGGPAAVRRRTLEECLEEALWQYGPVIAVGRPGERLPPAGAAREYLSDAVWRIRVREHIAEARMIAVILGGTEGLRDEYQMLREAGATGKVVAVFPPVAPAERAARWAIFSPVPLPATQSTMAAVSRALLAQPTTDGSLRLITCAWQDEECYVLALRCCLV